MGGGSIRPRGCGRRLTQTSLAQILRTLVASKQARQAVGEGVGVDALTPFGGVAEHLGEGAGKAPVKAVAPDWGTCVIFETDTHSVHGFSTPVTSGGRWRRSIALYYYTSEDTESFGGDTNTYWRPPRRLTDGRRLRYALHDALLLVARGISFLAHRVDPHLGSRSRPRR